MKAFDLFRADREKFAQLVDRWRPSSRGKLDATRLLGRAWIRIHREPSFSNRPLEMGTSVESAADLILRRHHAEQFSFGKCTSRFNGNIVPGIDFTNDPLLQGRLFSYLDTQLIRLGGPNFNEIPINRPVAPLHNNQRDGYTEQNHIINALRFELGKVETPPIRERILFLLSQVDKSLANKVAEGLGMKVPAKLDKLRNLSFPADGDPKKFQPKRATQAVETSKRLSMVDNPNFPKDTIKTRKIARHWERELANE